MSRMSKDMGPDMCSNCLQRLSADGKNRSSKERDNDTYL